MNAGLPIRSHTWRRLHWALAATNEGVEMKVVVVGGTGLVGSKGLQIEGFRLR